MENKNIGKEETMRGRRRRGWVEIILRNTLENSYEIYICVMADTERRKS